MSLISPEAFSAGCYDYVVAGGGTAGLTLAARLTENPEVSVAVVEAGVDRSGDLSVNAYGLTGSMFGDPRYDWAFSSVPQVNDDNKVIAFPRGRMLGGSSGTNFWYWNHASQADINGWEEMGNEGWSWNDLFPYFLKSEHYIAAPENEAQDLDVSYIDPAYHGAKGPVEASYPPIHGPVSTAWNPTFANLGLSTNGDPYGGNATGSFTTLVSQNRKNSSRCYADPAYYKPNAGRPNLKVLTGALVNKVIFDDRKDAKQSLVARGLNFTSGSKNYVVEATREVILSAGVVQSPQLLELSGIGSAKLLNSLRIEVLVDNANVGENLQDHQYTTLSFEAADGYPTLDELNVPALKAEAIADYLANRTGILAEATCGTAYLSYTELLKSTKKQSAVPDNKNAFNTILDELEKNNAGELQKNAGLSKQWELVTDKLLDPQQPFTQELYSLESLSIPPVPGRFVSIFGLLSHPYSRGSIHINSSDPTAYPVIDPRFLSNPLDLEILSTLAFHLEKVATTQPLASLLKGNGTVFAPGNQHLTDCNVQQHVRDTLSSFQHPLGTCAMEPRDKGGVVDANLTVYGTSNLRVVDASVIPMQPVGTIQTLAYAIGEKAADMIKQGH